MDDPSPDFALSRRGFVQSAVTAAGAVALPIAFQAPRAAGAADAAAPPGQSPITVTLRVNRELHEVALEPRVTLLDALRDVIGLAGTKKGCDRGQCGACTVLVNGRRINSCLSLAVMHANDEIVTIEGLAAPDGRLHPMQSAFIEHDAFQCGFCTPGQICSAVALIEENRRAGAKGTPSDSDIRERMSGNICRCGAYPNIVAAVRSVANGVAEPSHG